MTAGDLDLGAFCRSCDGELPKPLTAFEVRVQYTADRKNWRVDVLDPKGEVIMRERCQDQAHARALCDQLSRGIEHYVKARRAGQKP